MLRLGSSLLLLLCLPLLTTACSSLGLGGGGDRARVVDEEIAALKDRVVDLQRQATIDKVEIDRLRQKLAALEDRVVRESEERAAEAERATAPRGLTEETVPAPRQVAVIEVSDLEEPLEEEPAPVAAATPPDAAESVAAGDVVPELAERVGDAAPAPRTGSGTGVTSAAQALYDQGYSLYHQGRYVDAEETFQRFVAAFAETDLGDNARYWIGECRLAREELESALAAFRETVREYPAGNKTPDALLRAGEVLERLGDVDGARVSYREVERRFPESAASEEASRRLQRL